MLYLLRFTTKHALAQQLHYLKSGYETRAAGMGMRLDQLEWVGDDKLEWVDQLEWV